MKFEKYDIADVIKRNLADMGFKRPTDIQYKSIPSILKGEDVLAIAQTGTGKTAAFAIPVVDQIHAKKRSKRNHNAGIQCLVMVPTRELAEQIGKAFNSIARNTRTKAFALIGGVEQDRQISKLQSGIDVLIATPGRMFDLISQGFIELKNVRTLVLDEADHMLGLGFIEDIKYVKRMLRQRHQTLFFSATINKEIKKLAYSQVRSSAIRIQIAPEDPISKNVSHFVVFVEMDDKRFFLENFVERNPKSKMLVFVRTRVRAERVAKAMKRVGIDSITLHGDMDQQKRSEAMDTFRDSDSDLLIATDVSARGIDIPQIKFVINYDLPDIAENYVHRVGRTGRGKHVGDAISFCSTEEREKLAAIQDFIGKPIEEIKVSKNDYAEIVKPHSDRYNLQALLEEQEAWEKKRKKKRKRKK